MLSCSHVMWSWTTKLVWFSSWIQTNLVHISFPSRGHISIQVNEKKKKIGGTKHNVFIIIINVSNGWFDYESAIGFEITKWFKAVCQMILIKKEHTYHRMAKHNFWFYFISLHNKQYTLRHFKGFVMLSNLCNH